MNTYSRAANDLNHSYFHNPDIWEVQHALPTDDDYWDKQVSTIPEEKQETLEDALNTTLDDTTKAIILTYLALNPRWAANNHTNILIPSKQKEHIKKLLWCAHDTTHPLHAFVVKIITTYPMTELTKRHVGKIVDHWDNIKNPQLKDTVTQVLTTNPYPRLAAYLSFIVSGLNQVDFNNQDVTDVAQTVLEETPKLIALQGHDKYMTREEYGGDKTREMLTRICSNIGTATSNPDVKTFHKNMEMYMSKCTDGTLKNRVLKTLKDTVNSPESMAAIGNVLIITSFVFASTTNNHKYKFIDSVLSNTKGGVESFMYALDTLLRFTVPAARNTPTQEG